MIIWTGVACLVKNPACQKIRRFGKDGKGAYVNVVGLAESEEAFVLRIKEIALTLDCILVDLNDVQPLDRRIEQEDSPEELITMRTTSRRQPKDVMFGTFHIWTHDDAN